MKSVNRVTLLGHTTHDPELKAIATGKSVCTVGLATNRLWKDNKGEWQNLPEFHNLVAWGKLAEFLGNQVRKGKPLYVEGYLKTRSWESEKNGKQFRTEVVIDNAVLLGQKTTQEKEAPAAEPGEEA